MLLRFTRNGIVLLDEHVHYKWNTKSLESYWK